MASKKEPYETIAVLVTPFSTQRKIANLAKKGWEVVSTTRVGARNTVTLRRPNPKYRGAR
jgi:hypothetical protein